ncbi:MAG: hypothetical protein JKX85_13980 [Phycisphaeraceae bacterium]|nr:hypothetical protein [Phycisphaeraceae bacterium]
MSTKQAPGLNDRALILTDELATRSAELGIKPSSVVSARMIDAGIESLGSLRAGLLIAQISMANLASVTLAPNPDPDPKVMSPVVVVNVTHPIAACLASQHAGWLIEDQAKDFRAYGSGPFRAAYGKEELFDTFGFRERTNSAVGIIESPVIPSRELVHELSIMCGVQQHHLAIICVNPASLAGSVLTASRTVQWALMKLHQLNINIRQIVGGYGICPLGNVGGTLNQSISRAYDQLINHSQVTLYAKGDDATLANVIKQLASNTPKHDSPSIENLLAIQSKSPYDLKHAELAPTKICIQNIESGQNHYTF